LKNIKNKFLKQNKNKNKTKIIIGPKLFKNDISIFSPENINLKTGIIAEIEIISKNVLKNIPKNIMTKKSFSFSFNVLKRLNTLNIDRDLYFIKYEFLNFFKKFNLKLFNH
jgi:hypothetical protein